MSVMQAALHILTINAKSGLVESCSILSTHEAAPLTCYQQDLAHSDSADMQADELCIMAWWRGGLS